MDKRFGENDPSMAPEEKMLERFTLEKQRHHKHSAFDLEDDDMQGELTHMGQSLSLDGPALADDFDEEDLELSDAEDHPSDDERQARKRRRSPGAEGEEDDEEEGEDRPERKKSKQEVMTELIAKSKQHKYERQAAKDDDEDLREELDKEMSSIHALLRGLGPKAKPMPPPITPGMNPDRAALLNGTDKIKFDKEYDLRLRQLALDARSKPTEPSKTEDERVEAESRKLRQLEEKRQRRMQGEPQSSDEEDAVDNNVLAGEEEDEEDDFGLGSGIKTRPTMSELGVEDEDDFVIDDDLVASGSDLEVSEGESSGDEEDEEQEADDDEDTEFLKGLLTEEEAKRPEFLTGANAPIPEVELPEKNGVSGNLAYTFNCPQSHEELLEVTKGIALLDLPTVVQRIRALYHPKLNSENKGKLRDFSVSLIDHISYLANQPTRPPFSVLENIIRHIHSLAKTYPLDIANSFRSHLEDLHENRSLAPTPGDLIILTAIGSVFSTSDHFHQVVTPAILSMSRYLGLKIPQTLSDYATGAYVCTLSLHYLRLSKRYVPELVSFIENTLCALAPKKLVKLPGDFPYHEPKTAARIENVSKPSRRLTLFDCVEQDLSEDDEGSLKIAILETNLALLEVAAETWAEKPSFTELFEPTIKILQHFGKESCQSNLPPSTQVSSYPMPSC